MFVIFFIKTMRAENHKKKGQTCWVSKHHEVGPAGGGLLYMMLRYECMLGMIKYQGRCKAFVQSTMC